MAKFLKEFAEFEYEKLYDETEGQKKVRRSKYGNMLVRGVLQRANTQNANGRVYPLDVLRREVSNYKKLIDERRATGELDHADEPTVNLKFVSHVITDVWWEDDVVYGEVEILENMDQGRQLKVLFENDIKVGISSRALGSVERHGDVNVVQDDLQLICWDFVSEPSTPGAFMFKEGKEVDVSSLQGFFKKSDMIDRVANEVLDFHEQIKKGNKK
jgi:hypothetical protein